MRPGKRIGRKGEITGIGPVAPGGAKLFRERLPQIQAEAGYWETRVGTVHDFRVTLIDNDTRILFTIVYDGAIAAPVRLGQASETPCPLFDCPHLRPPQLPYRR